jgi:hypothetical protein
MTRPPRIRVLPNDELAVLDKSRRRCALCFHISGDLTEKHGQIAHLDHDRTNSVEENLAFFVSMHHSLYDSKTSQHKNYSDDEVRQAREALYAAIRDERHLHASFVPTTGRQADKRTMDEIMAVFEDEDEDVEFFRRLDFNNSFEKCEDGPIVAVSS